MTDRLTIVAEPRTVTGKKVKQLRRNGYIPGVIYGQSDPVTIQMEGKALRRALRVVGTTQLVDVDLNGRPYTVLPREIQQHLTRRDILHVDFLEVDLKQKITAVAELVTVGQAGPETIIPGRAALMQHTIDIECLPEALISTIEIDITQIESVNDVIRVSDLPVPEGVTLLADEDLVLVRYQVARTAEVDEEEVEEEELDEEIVESEGEEQV